VLEVVRGLQADVSKGSLPHFNFKHINALRLPNAQHVYKCLAEALTGLLPT
jgi:hypothetical protein